MTPLFTIAEVYEELTIPYLPKLNPNLDLDEEEEDYIERMRSFAPSIPEEVAREWFFRHFECLDHYSFLDFSTLRFELQTWSVEQIPGREAFSDPKFCENFSDDFKERVKDPHNWLAHYMEQHGTWNTPIILLHNPDAKFRGNSCYLLRSPWHLLEGHNRLSFFQHLRNIGTTKAHHQVWAVFKD